MILLIPNPIPILRAEYEHWTSLLVVHPSRNWIFCHWWWFKPVLLSHPPWEERRDSSRPEGHRKMVRAATISSRQSLLVWTWWHLGNCWYAPDYIPLLPLWKKFIFIQPSRMKWVLWQHEGVDAFERHHGALIRRWRWVASKALPSQRLGNALWRRACDTLQKGLWPCCRRAGRQVREAGH